MGYAFEVCIINEHRSSLYILLVCDVLVPAHFPHPQDKLLELGVQQKNLEELIVSLREASSDKGTTSAPARLTEWHSKLGELRLVELRVTRANQRLRERVTQLEGLVGSSEQAFTKLEHQLVAVTKVSHWGSKSLDKKAEFYFFTWRNLLGIFIRIAFRILS